ncbi:MAG: hypothetical protein JXB29_00210, partial [Sedimentisphaerales bacterium]|nr:hypothetical protein [Sedimentisphaerales bacterium]
KLSSVFLDNNAAKELRCHNCKDEKEALKAAKRNSFDIVAVTISSLRREFWQEKIKCMFGVSAVHDKKLIFLLEALAPAA